MHSPTIIIFRETLHYKRHLALKIGQYYQLREDDKRRNIQAASTKAAMCLGPSGNTQVGFKFISLQCSKKITRDIWDAIPMPYTVIARVNELAKGEPETFMFTDRKGRIIGDAEITGVDTIVNQ